MQKKMKQASQRSKAKPATKPAAKASAKATTKKSNPIADMAGKVKGAYDNLQKSRTSMWQDYKTGYDANQGKMKK